ncbi:HAMP domain-containing sensor histidine kinase [Massilia sp. W12]|uniref:sensor histidine kinase n=1 Tax=Massilia sp. W12 TaxID=3126507 RepID=UPI0030D26F7A
MKPAGQDKPVKPAFLPLSVKLVAWVFIFSSLFTVLMTLILIGMRYTEERDHARAQLEFAINSYSKSLANSLWEMDMVSTELQIEALSRFPLVGHLVLTTGVGPQFHYRDGKPDPSPPPDADKGGQFFRENLASPADSSRVVGQLWLFVDEQALLKRMGADALRILVLEAIKGALLGLLVIWLVSRLITRHLEQMAHDTAALHPDTLGQPIQITRRHHARRDELDMLCDAFNKLHHDLVHYHRRRQLEARMRGQEKLAALSALVAGVAHEMNTPLGNSLIMASALHDKTRELLDKVEQKKLRQSELQHYLHEARDGADLLLGSLSKAADMVQSFKQVAIDRSTAYCENFELAQVCRELAATMAAQIRQNKHQIILDVPAGIMLNSYPLPLSQVLAALIENALVHAYAPGVCGVMQIQASARPDGVTIIFADDGKGIAPEHIERVFDPFFTTRMGQGRNGLGLHICYNIVTSLLRGQIRVESSPGQGARFILDLPLDWRQTGEQDTAEAPNTELP